MKSSRGQSRATLTPRAPARAGAVSLNQTRAQEQDFFAQVIGFEVELEPPLPVAVSVTV